MTRPVIDFFIVGAPKCGTTSLFKYLGSHSDIFIPDLIVGNTGKVEPNHFAPDFQDMQTPYRSRETFFSLYDDKLPHQFAGDASVYHLYSPHAPTAIYSYNSEAKIIIMIRHPVDFILSYYQEMRFTGLETCKSLKEALSLEPRRLNGTTPMPKPGMNPLYLGYRELARYSKPIRRYLSKFPRENVHFIKFDTFVEHTPLVYGSTLNFLDVKPWWPDTFHPFGMYGGTGCINWKGSSIPVIPKNR